MGVQESEDIRQGGGDEEESEDSLKPQWWKE